MVRRQQVFRLARGPAEQPIELLVRHLQAGAVIEIGLVEPKTAVRLEVDQMVEDQAGIFGFAIWRQAHHFVLAGIYFEARVVGESGVKQAERMREVQFLERGEFISAAVGDRGRRPLADPVHCQDCGLLERRGKKSRGCMALVMLGEKQLALPVEVRRVFFQLIAQELLLEQLFAEPKRDGHAKRTKSPRREDEIGLQQSLELEEWLIVEDDVIDRIERGRGRIQAIGERLVRKAGIVFLAREPFFLRRCDDTAVLDDRGRAVVIEGR